MAEDKSSATADTTTSAQAGGDKTTADATKTTTTTGADKGATGQDKTTSTQDQTTQQADWPDDWRTKISADEKHQKDLAKFASPKALYESYRAMQQRISTGELRSNLPENATAEDVAKWRKANGIPEKAEGYLEGVKLEEADKGAAELFIKAAHEMNLHPKQVKGILEWRQKLNTEQAKKQEEETAKLTQETEDTYRTEWGNDYRKNLNLIQGLMDTTTASEELRKDLAETMKINPELGRWLIQVAGLVNPVPSLVPGGSENVASSVEDEIARIEKVMKENRKAYNEDEKMQNRLRELYAARERLGKRAA